MSRYLRPKRDETYATRVAYGEALAELGAVNSRVVVLDADLMGSTRTDVFAAKFPERFFEVGISEADMIGVAAGLAHEGFIPFASSFAIFLTGKTYDQIRQSVSYSMNPVRLVATHAGLQPGPDGATHQGLEDIALMRAMPGITVIAPADAVETRKAVFALADYHKPVYMRLGRSDWPLLLSDDAPFKIGQALALRPGNDLALIAYGQLVSFALDAAERLAEQGIRARVLNMSTIEPMDTEAVERAAVETGALVVAEEHQAHGGLGEAIAAFLAANGPVPVGFVAMPNSFGESGTPHELMQKYGLTSERIERTALETLARKRGG
ncbi:MAG: transketolase family protein [Anaerolineales bacterium]|jgi:transketolase